MEHIYQSYFRSFKIYSAVALTETERISRDPDEYRCADGDEANNLLCRLVDALLLDGPAQHRF